MTTITIKDRPMNELVKELLEVFATHPKKYTIQITFEKDQTDVSDGLSPEWKEENLQPKFIEKMERSNEDVRAGRTTICKTEKENDDFFNEILNA